MYQSPSFSVRWIVELKKTFKGLCHPRCMRRLIITLKSLAQLFQIPSESSGGCYIALDVNVKVYRLILKNCLYSTESDSVCRNQTNLRRNTPLRKRPTGLESACAPADIVPLNVLSCNVFPPQFSRMCFVSIMCLSHTKYHIQVI